MSKTNFKPANGISQIPDKNGGKKSHLGTIVLNAAVSDFDPQTGEILDLSNRFDRFTLQDSARHILTNHEKDIKKKHRIYACTRIPTEQLVAVLKSPEHQKSFFGNLMTCKNVWACPVCSAIVSQRRQSDLRAACEKARSMGLKVTMMTLTTRHGIDDQLDDTLLFEQSFDDAAISKMTTLEDESCLVFPSPFPSFEGSDLVYSATYNSVPCKFDERKNIVHTKSKYEKASHLTESGDGVLRKANKKYAVKLSSYSQEKPDYIEDIEESELKARHMFKDDISKNALEVSLSRKGLMSRLCDSFRLFTSHRQFKDFRKDFGVVGYVKATEITYSDNNGWHPHFHILVFSEKSISSTYSYIDGRGSRKFRCLPEIWQKCCEKSGLPVPSLERGLVISDEEHDFDERVAEYMSKFFEDTKIEAGMLEHLLEVAQNKMKWDLSAEISNWHKKTGRNGSLTPFDFLRLYSTQFGSNQSDGSMLRKYHELFTRFVRAMRGRAQHSWSTGLRDLLDLEPEKTDDQIIEEAEVNADVYAYLLRKEFKYYVLKGRRAELLHNAETSTVEQFARYLFFTYYKDKSSSGYDPVITFEFFYSSFEHRYHDLDD